MTAAAREIRAHGCPVLLCGPFTEQIHDAARWRAWVAGLGAATVRLVWVKSDAPTLRDRLASRGSDRDTAKLAEFATFIARMRPGVPPPVPHAVIDNRLSASTSLAAQVAALLTTALPPANPPAPRASPRGR